MPIRGRMKYVPAYVIEEIEQIKRETRVTKDNIAMFKMVEGSRVARELERIKRLDFTMPPLLMPKKRRR